jgi:hypothetical protein
MDEIEAEIAPRGAPVARQRMIRVVLDTNIIVSALLQHLGPPAQVFSRRAVSRPVNGPSPVAVLAQDVAQVFTDAESVNAMLRSIIKALPRTRDRSRR